MSAYNWLMDHTYGAWRDWLQDGETVNEWGLAQINERIAEDIARASGVGVGGQTVVAPPEVVAARIKAAFAEVANHLRSEGLHPEQATFELTGPKIRSTIILVAALGIGAYFAVEVLKAYVSRRR